MGKSRIACASTIGLVSLAIVATAGSAARAQLVNENLLVTMPQGFVVGSHAENNAEIMQEWVRNGETVDNWTEMVTVQIFRGRKDFDPGRFLAGMGRQWLGACPSSKPETIHSGQANGYPVSMLMLHCPFNPQTKKPENTLFRAIKGDESFYLVQKAFRFQPSDAQVADAAKYLGTVNVCDTRMPEHPCSSLPPNPSPASPGR